MLRSNVIAACTFPGCLLVSRVALSVVCSLCISKPIAEPLESCPSSCALSKVQVLSAMGSAGKSKGSGKKRSTSHNNYGKRLKTKRSTKDVDQIHEDMAPKNKEKLLNQPINDDLPGRGQNYCLHCA